MAIYHYAMHRIEIKLIVLNDIPDSPLIALSPSLAGEHDIGPGLSCGTPAGSNIMLSMGMVVCYMNI